MIISIEKNSWWFSLYEILSLHESLLNHEFNIIVDEWSFQHVLMNFIMIHKWNILITNKNNEIFMSYASIWKNLKINFVQHDFEIEFKQQIFS